MHKAKPTEYKGIRFRSKSEAMFAYILDNRWDGFWFYEPYQVDDYLVDFSLITKNEGTYPIEFLIEYKPSSPTDTYLEFVFSKYHELKEKAFGKRVSFMLISLNMYDSSFDAEEYYFNPDSDVGYIKRPDTEADVWENWAREARNYRFDLK